MFVCLSFSFILVFPSLSYCLPFSCFLFLFRSPFFSFFFHFYNLKLIFVLFDMTFLLTSFSPFPLCFLFLGRSCLEILFVKKQFFSYFLQTYPVSFCSILFAVLFTLFSPFCLLSLSFLFSSFFFLFYFFMICFGFYNSFLFFWGFFEARFDRLRSRNRNEDIPSRC